MDAAIAGAANAIFFNHGQCCCAGSRLVRFCCVHPTSTAANRFVCVYCLCMMACLVCGCPVRRARHFRRRGGGRGKVSTACVYVSGIVDSQSLSFPGAPLSVGVAAGSRRRSRSALVWTRPRKWVRWSGARRWASAATVHLSQAITNAKHKSVSDDVCAIYCCGQRGAAEDGDVLHDPGMIRW